MLHTNSFKQPKKPFLARAMGSFNSAWNWPRLPIDPMFMHFVGVKVRCWDMFFSKDKLTVVERLVRIIRLGWSRSITFVQISMLSMRSQRDLLTSRNRAISW